MSRVLQAVVSLITGLVAVLIGAGASQLALAAPDLPAGAHVYDATVHSATVAEDAVERGPPAIGYDNRIRTGAIDHGARGDLVRPEPVPVWINTTYENASRSAQRVSGSGTTRTAYDGRATAVCAAQEVRCAAKTGAELPEGYSSFSAAKRAMGSPGEGNVFDHVVEQSQIGRSGFAPEEIHNPFNMNPVPSGVNQIKANYYSRKLDFANGGTVRDWLSGQPFDFQYSFGMKVLSDIRAGVIQ